MFFISLLFFYPIFPSEIAIAPGAILQIDNYGTINRDNGNLARFIYYPVFAERYLIFVLKIPR